MVLKIGNAIAEGGLYNTIICINELNVLGNELNVWSRVNYRWGQMQTVCLQPLQTICMQCICSRVAFTRRPPFCTYSRLLQNFLRRLLHSQFVNFIHNSTHHHETTSSRPTAAAPEVNSIETVLFNSIDVRGVFFFSCCSPPRVSVYNM